MAAARLPSSEVKGVWFVSLAKHLEGKGRRKVLDGTFARLSPTHPLRDPIASAWYPERDLQMALVALREAAGGLSSDAFATLMSDVTEEGIGRFFRVVLGLASPGFVFKNIPVMWSRIRRGAGKVVVDVQPEAAVVRYTDFPWFADENYRLLTVGSLRTLQRVAGAKGAVEIVHRADDALTVKVSFS